jgi:hypothetical protein
MRHVTPDILATHLPRPLWARLFTACLGAPRVDAQLVVDTIGIPNLCEHIPWSIIWGCIAEMGARSLGKSPDITVAPDAPRPPVTAPTPAAPRAAVLAPPPEEKPAPPPAPAPPPPPAVVGPSIPAPSAPVVNAPLADLISELEADGASNPGGEPRMGKLRPRSPTAERFRQSNTAVRGLTGRRPPASASSAPNNVTASGSSGVRRGQTEVEDPETAVSEGANWQRGGDVDDSQMVEWKADGTGDDDFSDLGRKR